MARAQKAALALVILVVSFGLLYGGVMVKLIHDWWVDEGYSHGFLVVPLATYFVWERRRVLRLAMPRPSSVGLLVLLISIMTFMAGLLGAELFLTRVAVVGTIAGAVLFILGWEHLRVLAFPLGFLLLMIPWPSIIFNQVAFPLQLVASRLGEGILAAQAIPVLREGNLIVLPHATLEVVEACSGIRSLLSLVTLAILLAYFSERRWSARIAIVAMSAPIAIVSNGLRVAGTGMVAHYVGAGAAEGFFHGFSGWLVFVAAFGMLVAGQQAVALTGRLGCQRPVGEREERRER